MTSILEHAARTASSFHMIKAMMRGTPKELGRLQLNCAQHGTYFSDRIGDLSGREVQGPCPDCLVAHEAELLRRKVEAEDCDRVARCDARIEDAGIPDRFRGRRLPDYRTEHQGQRQVADIAKRYLDDFHRVRRIGTSLVFAGTPGTGKSLLAMIIAQELCHLGYCPVYTTAQGLIQSIRRTWGKDGEGRAADVVDRFADAAFLVLDEIGVQAGTDNEKALLFEVLDRRYSSMRPSIFVTNLDKRAFQEFIGDRLWDRLLENATWVPFAWDSYRPTAKRELREALAADRLPPEQGPTRRPTTYDSPWGPAI